jgi:GH24 family phage-related lysozyme (muramidase)
MKISSTLFEHMKKMEAIRPHVYDDATGKDVSDWTQVVGYPTIALGKKIEAAEKAVYAAYLKGKSKLEGSALKKVIDETFTPREKKLEAALKVPVTQSMFDALFSFSFNTGFGAKSFKNVLALVNAGDYTGAQQAIANGPSTSKGKSLPGLVARRKYESELFAAEGLSPSGAAMAGFQSSYGRPTGTHYGYLPIEYTFAGPQHDAYKADTGAWWARAPVRVVFGAMGGAIGYGVLGYVIGAIAPGISRQDGLKYGAIAGALAGGIRGVIPPGKNK